MTLLDDRLARYSGARVTAERASVSRKTCELAVVIPTFNERDNVAPLIQRLSDSLRGIDWQAIFVDDNSPDGTAEAIKAMAARDWRISCIRRVGRRGLAGAVLEGALATAAPYVGVI